VLDGTANSDGAGLLVRGLEYQPQRREDFCSHVLDPLIRLALLADEIAEHLRDSPDPAVRRSAAVLSARAHPLLVAFDA
jgi:hypothetical protein